MTYLVTKIALHCKEISTEHILRTFCPQEPPKCEKNRVKIHDVTLTYRRCYLRTKFKAENVDLGKSRFPAGEIQ